MENCIRLVITGPPSSGKTTQGRLLAQTLSVPFIEIGKLIRDEIDAETELGKVAKNSRDNGKQPPSEILTSILSHRLNAK